MEIAVVGSNMVDLISYINRMPTDGETVEAQTFTWVVEEKVLIKP